jgi:predicted metal-dependent phosphoesterase TrpH
MIDLHCHSHYSDGILSPDALLQKAILNGVRVLALTDHDTVAGLPAIIQAAENTNVRIINGIELSARWKKHTIHIIGLKVDIHHDHLIQLINMQNEKRIERAQLIAKCLQQSGVQDAYLKACEIAGHPRVGRPHFAQLLVNEKIVTDLRMAFKQFLIQGRSAYVPTSWLSLEDVVEGINIAGGVAVIAHPIKYKLTRSKLYELIIAFKLAGGSGIEVVSGDIYPTQVQEIAGLCLRFGLLASTGSDYHGDEVSRVALGRQRALPENCTPIWRDWDIEQGVL